jgi:8-oxo-dGTP pyrophosphatase MutT (NUDIX family)
MHTREALISALKTYQSDFAEEATFKTRFLDLLIHPRAFYRDHLPGHITCSAFIIDASRKLTLLTHHAKLNRWLQPGGHADGEEDIVGVARREAHEETGLQGITLLQKEIFDIDIHVIPPRNDFPEHHHYDIRFLFEASALEPLHVTDESHELAWKKLNELSDVTQNNKSMLRMAKKIKALS